MGPHVLFPQPVPFIRRLTGGLTARRTVIVKGFVPPRGQRYRTQTEAGILRPLLPQTCESGPQPFPPPQPHPEETGAGPFWLFISLSVPSFAINFRVESSGDLALHINVRMNEGAVVRNSYLNGSWGSEERSLSHNPFGPGQFFDVSLGLSSLPPKPPAGLWPHTSLPAAVHPLWQRSLQGLRQWPAPLRLLPPPFSLPEGGRAGDPG